MAKTLTLNGLEIKWLGHASFLLKGGNKVIYIDPYNISGGEHADLILITHHHFDHCDANSIKELSKEGTIVVGPQKVADELKEGVEVINAGEKKTAGGVEIEAVPAYNVGKSFHPKGEGVGYLVKLAGKKIYHAGDTDNIPEMADLAGKVDLALLPSGGTYTMDAQEAAQAVKLIKPKIAVPMHYGSLSETPGDPVKFKELVGNVCRVEILE